jgi:hypothetical protein
LRSLAGWIETRRDHRIDVGGRQEVLVAT